MKKRKTKEIFAILIILVLTAWTTVVIGKDLEIKGKKLVSLKPPFTCSMPSEFQLIHSASVETPRENSLTRAYFLIKEKSKRVEEMLIIEVADKTNPQAAPMTVPPLKPYTEKRLYLHDNVKKGELRVDYLVQLMAWNPEAPSLQPIVKKGISIPSRWALQGQFLFLYLGQHAVFCRYSKDILSFGLTVSEKGEDWNKDSLKGNEMKICGTFKKTFMEIIDSIRVTP
jgi:hypothetical protein